MFPVSVKDTPPDAVVLIRLTAREFPDPVPKIGALMMTEPPAPFSPPPVPELSVSVLAPPEEFVMPRATVILPT